MACRFGILMTVAVLAAMPAAAQLQAPPPELTLAPPSPPATELPAAVSASAAPSRAAGSQSPGAAATLWPVAPTPTAHPRRRSAGDDVANRLNHDEMDRLRRTRPDLSAADGR